jgi:putative membrane protein
MTDQSEDVKPDATKLAMERTVLAYERTELALERTQLAWVRTTLAFLGSGIALDKGMELMHRDRIEKGTALVQNAHVGGLTLSIAGTLLIIYTTWFFIRRSRTLAKMKGGKTLMLPPGAMASFLVILLGIIISFLLLVS